MVPSGHVHGGSKASQRQMTAAELTLAKTDFAETFAQEHSPTTRGQLTAFIHLGVMFWFEKVTEHILRHGC